MAATDDQLFRSEDEGESWRPILRRRGRAPGLARGRPALRAPTRTGAVQVLRRRRRQLRGRGPRRRRALRDRARVRRRAVPGAQRRNDPAHRGRRRAPWTRCSGREAAGPGRRGRPLPARRAAADAGRSALARAPGGGGRVLPLGRRDLAQHSDRSPERQPHRVPRPDASTAAWTRAPARPAS